MKIIHRELLPSPTNSVHASTVEIWNKKPIFGWFGGTQEGSSDVGIYLYDSNSQGVELGCDDPIPRWNPILVNYNDRLMLFEKRGQFCDRWQTFFHNDISEWDRDCWDRPAVLPAGLNGPVKSRPLIQGNIMYCGSSVETMYDWTSYIETYEITNIGLIFKDRSKPLCIKDKKTYKNRYGRERETLGIIQPTLWVKKGVIYALFRSSCGLEKLYLSYNDGSGWSDPKPTNLNNPNSAVDVAVINDEVYLIWNSDPKFRYPLILSNIELTENNIYDIDIKRTICIDDSLDAENYLKKGCNSPELSYPYMINEGNKLHITYTYGRSKISYVVVEV